MENAEIKKECELMYEQIKKAQERLKEIRSICKHENQFEGNYSWRIGAINRAIMCVDCGECIKFIN